jgi:hypothetical protein
MPFFSSINSGYLDNLIACNRSFHCHLSHQSSRTSCLHTSSLYSLASHSSFEHPLQPTRATLSASALYAAPNAASTQRHGAKMPAQEPAATRCHAVPNSAPPGSPASTLNMKLAARHAAKVTATAWTVAAILVQERAAHRDRHTITVSAVIRAKATWEEFAALEARRIATGYAALEPATLSTFQFGRRSPLGGRLYACPRCKVVWLLVLLHSYVRQLRIVRTRGQK